MSGLTPQQHLIQHRQELEKLTAEARTRQGMVAFSGYVGGYCDNSDCAVRQVLVRVSAYNEPIEEVRCPACRSLLLLGEYEFGVTVFTGQEFNDILKRRARQDVQHQIRRERGQECFTVAELCNEVSLDDLAQAFRERDAKQEIR